MKSIGARLLAVLLIGAAAALGWMIFSRIQEQGALWGEKSLIRLWTALQKHPRWVQTFFSFIKKMAGLFPGSFPPGLNFPEKSFHQWWQDEKPD